MPRYVVERHTKVRKEPGDDPFQFWFLLGVVGIAMMLMRGCGLL